MEPKVIAERLRALRGMRTLATVSAATGLSQQAISNYENGIRIPRDETKVVLARYYNKTVQEIFFD